MKTPIFALSVSLLAVSAAAYAAPAAGIPNLTDIAIDGGGNVINMDQTDAAQYCQNMGDRLPTIRELALWATQYGAKVSDTPQNGFDEIQGADAAGNPDTFYYQYSGYQEAPEQYWYWSSSVVPGASNFAYDLVGDSGYIGLDVSRSDFIDGNAVRCVQSR